MADEYIGTLPTFAEIMRTLQPSPEEQRRARMEALATAGFSLLGAPKGREWQALGNAGLVGLSAQRQYALDAAQRAMQQIAMQQHAMQLAQQYSNAAQADQFRRGFVSPPVQGGPSTYAPYQGPGMGDRGLGTTIPPQQQAQLNEPPALKALRDAGVSDLEIQGALAEPNPQAAITKLLTEYRKPMFGQGKIPIVRGRNDTFTSVLPAGSLEATAAQTATETGAQEAAKSMFDIVTVKNPDGSESQMTRAQAIARGNPGGQETPAQQAMPTGAAGIPPGARVFFGPGASPNAPNIKADLAGLPSQYSMPPPSPARTPMPSSGPLLPGEIGRTSNPLAMKEAESRIGTQATQNTKIAEAFANDYATAIKAEHQAPQDIARYNLLKDYFSKVQTGKIAPTVLGLKAAAAYVFPELAKSWTADVPFAQAATALSNQMALELRNPSQGAGMPGNLSDKDVQILQSMISSAANDPRAIPLILDARIAVAKRNQEIGKLARQYRKDHDGVIDEGFYQQVQDYANTHPLFSGGSAGASSGRVVDFSALPTGGGR